MRQRKLDLHARVNGDVALDFSDVALTSFRRIKNYRSLPLLREALKQHVQTGKKSAA